MEGYVKHQSHLLNTKFMYNKHEQNRKVASGVKLIELKSDGIALSAVINRKAKFSELGSPCG